MKIVPLVITTLVFLLKTVKIAAGGKGDNEQCQSIKQR
jgi:hypothetical protein